ncbi:hypothetical protein O4H49_20320 [Kiloniella laminariae]|uniref:Uncharacterized protein n=1 Tax=Kiloniella laminariae TaxID=454162 RepID=A0ABT4LS36_9PROT|nr:hypothetical protein [Kiloniella laminariae]MCZ4283141.1 hypothetical protein [Kiloniella laminariae]
MYCVSEFPDFVLDIELPDGFTDCSFRGEPCPCFGKELPDGSILRLIVDYAEVSRRDFPETPRFCCEYWSGAVEAGVAQAFVQSDDWNHILNWIKFMERWGGVVY